MSHDLPSSAAQKLRIVHFSDKNGRIQVIFPETRLLNLEAVFSATQRRFRPIYHRREQDNNRLKPNTQTLIDQEVFQFDLLAIQNSAGNGYETISSDALKQRFAGPLNYIDDFCIELGRVPQPVAHHKDDEQQLRQALGEFKATRVTQRLEETLEMPALSATCRRIIQLCANPNADAEELCKIINLDPSLAAQVMSWASSPYYGTNNKVDSIDDAIIRIVGFDMVLNLALGLSMGASIEPPKNGPRHFQEFWLDAVSHAILMDLLVQRVSPERRPQKGHAYLAGLLHNFGYLILGAVLPPYFSALSRQHEANPHLPADMIEMFALGFTQQQLAFRQFKQWQLPDNVCTAIRYSTQPEYQGDHAPLTKLLHLAQRVYRQQEVPSALLNDLGLTPADTQKAYQQLLESSAYLQIMANLIKKQ
ncbi:HDOD domain-containing protein [Marinomonas dokdonensis]|uniref:HDOD domain-containing protein n=1 Tax=Marinomonas dokdonensis TaxID=328224 RepID=UPI00405595BD